MFRKLVSSLSFSPALVGQLSFYARRLKKEEASRKAGLIFTVLALIVQSFAVFIPPESANASSPNNFVAGGVSTLDEYLQLYDKNAHSLKDIMTAASISRAEISSLAPSTFELNRTITYNRLPQVGAEKNERSLNYAKSDGTYGTVYGRPHEAEPSTGPKTQEGWAGYSKANGWFAITSAGGNLVTERFVASDQGLSTIKYSKSARNLTSGSQDATTSLVRGADKIQYHLTVTNTGSSTVEIPIVDYLSDVLEYAQIIDTGGGSFNHEDRLLSWSPVKLNPGDSQTRSFLVQAIDPIPATPRGLSDTSSYDCVMTNTFGNTVQLSVACPSTKVVEAAVTKLPKINNSANLIFATILLIVTVYFYARSKQLQNEIRIIRRDLNAGTI